MISRKGLDDLTADYKEALGLVNKAAHTLEDNYMMVGGAGESFVRKSSALIEHLNDVYGEIQQVIHQLSEVKTDD
ncbi:MAG: hypothetical protein JWQ81_6065 [Amycolatopsis sp.]|uniref:hypothetical protein n=1 Tax=Amycolatopsis sp. TaxID=37632 RepID=UPI002615B288|nr:hypothetical protein [Amycolatopsis sp.]MCU1685326.1 hypothetical protein [Amycolatopsis sp.]